MKTHKGWQAIAKRMGCCENTARKRVRLYNIPVMRFGWVVELDETLYLEWLRGVLYHSMKDDEGVAKVEK